MELLIIIGIASGILSVFNIIRSVVLFPIKEKQQG